MAECGLPRAALLQERLRRCMGARIRRGGRGRCVCLRACGHVLWRRVMVCLTHLGDAHCDARGEPRPHLHRDWAHPAHICTGTGRSPFTSAPAPGPPLPDLRRDWAHPAHICTGTGPTPPASAPGPGSPRPHLHRDQVNPSYQVSVCVAWSPDGIDGRVYPTTGEYRRYPLSTP